MAYKEPDDDIVDDIDIPDEEEEKKPEAIGLGRAYAVALASLAASLAMFLTTLRHILTRSLIYHPIVDSIHGLETIFLIGIGAVVLGGFALRETRPYEGGAVRRIAIGASALSFIAELLLASSLYELMSASHAY